MTECERLIENGTFSPEFLKEEIRYDFLVTAAVKKIWTIELDLLNQFDVVCRRHGLKYFLMTGSTIGAIRHNGIIPWDDDIDVGMLRIDYDRIMDFRDEFQYPYFLQSPGDDSGYFYGFSKLRNSNTSCIVKTFKHRKFNQGIGLDIFPLDNWKVDAVAEFSKVASLLKEQSTWMRIGNPDLSIIDKTRVEQYSGRDPYETLGEINELQTRWKDVDTGFVALVGFCAYGYKRSLFRTDCFSDTVTIPFETGCFPVMKGYDHYLKVVYGDYMQLPPINERKTWHPGIIFDADTPYLRFRNDINRAV